DHVPSIGSLCRVAVNAFHLVPGPAAPTVRLTRHNPELGIRPVKSLSRRCRRRRVALTPSSSGANGKRFADAGREGAGLQAIALPVGAEKAYGSQAKAPAPPVAAP